MARNGVVASKLLSQLRCSCRARSSYSTEAAAQPAPAQAASQSVTAQPATAVKEPKKEPSSGYGLLLWLGAGSAAVGAWLYYYSGMLEAPRVPAGQPDARIPPPTIAPAPIGPVSPPPTVLPKLTAREELEQRQGMLKAELAALREQKRNKFVDTKKKEIKEDLKIIANSLAALDKQK